jgi:hypothetical protein
MYFNTVDALPFSFPFPPSPNSIEQFHYYKHVLHLSLYMIMLVFVYMFIFGFIFHIWEKTCSLCLSEPDLLHLTWCPPIASIHFQTTWCQMCFVKCKIAYAWINSFILAAKSHS